MATKTKTPKIEKGQQLSPTQFVTVDQFNDVVSILSKLSDKIDAIGTKTATPVEAAQVKAVDKAAHDQAPMNPAWEDKAREIIGEAVDHCEVLYPVSGGTLFTVVIKPEFSNAPKEYLERMHADRRTKDVEKEGIGGVENWAKLIRQNLRRAK
jgi:hypothetical protein